MLGLSYTYLNEYIYSKSMSDHGIQGTVLDLWGCSRDKTELCPHGT